MYLRKLPLWLFYRGSTGMEKTQEKINYGLLLFCNNLHEKGKGNALKLSALSTGAKTLVNSAFNGGLFSAIYLCDRKEIDPKNLDDSPIWTVEDEVTASRASSFPGQNLIHCIVYRQVGAIARDIASHLQIRSALSSRYPNALALNSEFQFRYGFRKDYILYLQSLGVAVSPTIPYVGPLDESSILTYSSFKFPNLNSDQLIIKPIHGELGLGVALVSGIDAIKRNMRYLGDIYEWLIQPLDLGIQEHGERSLHFFGGEFQYSAVKYVKDGEIRSNSNHRSSVSLYEPTTQELSLASEALGLLPIETTGVFRIDLLGTPQMPLISEIELVNPGFISCQFDDQPNSLESLVVVYKNLYDYIEKSLKEREGVRN